ncbi:metallophosphoesterase [Candidatus Saccharibacteria bacterium]|nr:metallophosphoesterase [Candidatus Saccharibacteria bacterium]
MKAFNLATYKFYRPEHDGLKIAVISDLHFSYQVKDEKLNALLKFLKKLRPSYIFIPGDLIDYADMIDDVREAERLLQFLEKLALLAPVLLSYGNHDFYRRAGKDWIEDRSESFFADVATLKNVHLLDNQSFTDQNLYVLGFTQDFKYYGPTHASFKNPGKENKSHMLKQLQHLPTKLLHDLPAKKIKFALIHSPVYLHQSDIAKELAEFDYTISGHMHNGVVPPVLDALWLSDKGLVAPAKNLFPPDVRRTIRTNEDKSIVVGPVTTFHQITGALHLANALYPTHVTLLEFSKDKKYARKPYVGHKYYSW